MTTQRIAAIPTMYSGVRFRSRLEARWAACFDGLGWEWEYEAFDLPGYIPDFIICGHTDFIAEIKPLDYLEGDIGEWTRPDARYEWVEVFEKIRRSGLTLNAFVFGAKIHRWENVYHPGEEIDSNYDNGPVIGMSDIYHPKHSFIGPCCLTYCDSCNNFNPNYGCYKKGCDAGASRSIPFSAMQDIWIEAGNFVQYKGAK